MTEPLLDLSTTVTRPTVVIDGAAHEILSPDELSAVDSHRLAAWGRRHDMLMAKDAPTPAEDREIADLVRLMSEKIMVGVPDEVRARLTDAMRTAIIEAFSVLPLGRRLKRLMEMAPAKTPRTGGPSE